MSCECAGAFGAHGVTFVGHGRGADLCFLKGFFDFFEVLEQTHVGGEFVCGFSDGCEGLQNLGVDFAGVGLACDGVGLFEAEAFGDELVELADFFGVVVEEGHEGGLGAGGAFYASAF